MPALTPYSAGEAGNRAFPMTPQFAAGSDNIAYEFKSSAPSTFCYHTYRLSKYLRVKKVTNPFVTEVQNFL